MNQHMTPIMGTYGYIKVEFCCLVVCRKTIEVNMERPVPVLRLVC